MNDYERTLTELNFEDFICLVFIAVAILNISGDKHEKKYIIEHDYHEKEKANKIFEISITISIIIYLYFVYRNYKDYQKVSEEKKELYQIKLLGSILFIVGGICLLYFQKKQKSFIGIPTIW